MLINGVSTEYLNVMDRSIHYGDGLFETVLCKPTVESSVTSSPVEPIQSQWSLCYWSQHFQRLRHSADRLQLHCPDEEVLLEDIRRLLHEIVEDTEVHDETSQLTKNQAYAIKIILTRGSGERGYLFPAKQAENRIVSVSPVASDYSSILSGHLLVGELYLCQQPVSINTGLAGLKHLNRLENVIARNEFATRKDCSYIDGLMLNDDANVIEGTMSNLFAVSGDLLITPDLQRSGVNGVMRDVIIELASSDDIDVRVRELKSDELLSMDAIFLTNSLIGMKSVNRLLDIDYEQSQITLRLFEKLQNTLEKHVHLV